MKVKSLVKKRLVGWVLWLINVCRLSYAKSCLYMYNKEENGKKNTYKWMKKFLLLNISFGRLIRFDEII